MNDVSILKKELDEALQHFLDNQNETVSLFSKDENLKKLARCIGEDTFRCLSEFEEAIIKAFSK